MRVGSYVVESVLGEGGMGIVYRARHVELERFAAIKVLHWEYAAQPQIIERFFNEARSAAKIDHPSVVEVYEVGYITAGYPFITMELLDGESLATRLGRLGRLDVGPALAIARGIARGLQAAHRHDIVHRDLKPDNIFLVPDEDAVHRERVKLLDFGIAKVKHSRRQTSELIGTPTYMSPEQCRALPTIDARADLYALGCVLFEMLCGRPPFVADNQGDMIVRHLTVAPPDPRSIDRRIPAPLAELIVALLQKSPDARPASAERVLEVIDSLGPVAAAPPQPPHLAPTVMVQVPRPTTLPRGVITPVPPPVHRGRRIVTSALVTLMVVAAITVVVVMARGGSAPPAGITVRPGKPVAPVQAVAPAVAPTPAPAPPPPPPAEPEPPAPVTEPAPTPPPKSDRERNCSEASFDRVIRSGPSESVVQATFQRLKRCKHVLTLDAFNRIQKQLTLL